MELYAAFSQDIYFRFTKVRFAGRFERGKTGLSV